ncbi:hypothetical protein JAO78_008765 [Alishewanella sp. 16-MA]|uniref:RiboL-PSP-HEPN domain-containing protein n=1 Tax=Alishewanella maricola TaxID=2795740 RepID=A0ABS8C3J2_9ALTE|nr:hypothetical protein [Alishewanella maricola]MCB5226906.1 hypothetical protein [Alishewanella maricola]
MGSVKEAYLESEEDRQENLADALGISWDELSQLDYTLTENISNEGLLYGYVITFSSNCNAEILSRIAGISKTRTISLSPWIFERSYEDQYALGAITQNIDHRESFSNEMIASTRILNLKIEDYSIRQLLLRQTFISIIGALETFLSDTFISKTLSSKHYLQQFVRTNPEFKQQKISISEIYDVSEKIKERAKTIMVNTIYHKLPTIREMYAGTFSIDFPDISNLQKYILIRHDLVHRNGKTTDGRLVNINDKLIEELRTNAVTFVEELTNKLGRNFDDDLPF